MKKWMLSAGGIFLAVCLFMAGCVGNGMDEKPTAAAEDRDAQEVPGAGTEIGAEAGEEVQSADGTGGDEAAQEQQRSLYDLYIAIDGQMVGHFQEVIDDYFQRVAFQEGFVLLDEEKECLPVGDAFYGQMEEAIERIEREDAVAIDGTAAGTDREGIDGSVGIEELVRSEDLDEAYRELYPVMWELAKALDQAAEYTSKKADMGAGYTEEDYAEEERLHEIIWKSYKEYEVLRVLFLEELDQVADAWEEKELELLKDQGFAAAYSIYAMIYRARELREAIEAQGIDDRRVEELDIQALRPLYEQYEKEAEACLRYLEDDAAMEEEGYPAGTAPFDTFKEQALVLRATLAELFPDEQQTAGADRSGQRTMGGDGASLLPLIPVQGRISHFDQDLSEMIDAYNALFEG